MRDVAPLPGTAPARSGFHLSLFTLHPRLKAGLAWLLLPELLVPALAALAISGKPRRVLLLLAVCGLVTVLIAAPRLPKWLMPLRGKWLRRGLLGFMLLGLALAGPYAVLKRVLILGWTVGQLQGKLLQSIPWRPYLRPFTPLLETPVPLLTKLPLWVPAALLGFLMLWQATLLWQLLDTSPKLGRKTPHP